MSGRPSAAPRGEVPRWDGADARLAEVGVAAAGSRYGSVVLIVTRVDCRCRRRPAATGWGGLDGRRLGLGRFRCRGVGPRLAGRRIHLGRRLVLAGSRILVLAATVAGVATSARILGGSLGVRRRCTGGWRRR